ncbi:unnamed protein product [Gordionus sp. m RMFG-2023]
MLLFLFTEDWELTFGVHYTVFNIAWGLELGLSVIMIFASLLLINGILKRIKKYFWPWMLSLPILIMIILFSSISNLALGNSIVQMLGTGIANLIMCFILIYCLLCVMSYYRDIDQADIP